MRADGSVIRLSRFHRVIYGCSAAGSTAPTCNNVPITRNNGLNFACSRVREILKTNVLHVYVYIYIYRFEELKLMLDDFLNANLSRVFDREIRFRLDG